jgi:hypothetical protein
MLHALRPQQVRPLSDMWGPMYDEHELTQSWSTKHVAVVCTRLVPKFYPKFYYKKEDFHHIKMPAHALNVHCSISFVFGKNCPNFD